MAQKIISQQEGCFIAWEREVNVTTTVLTARSHKSVGIILKPLQKKIGRYECQTFVKGHTLAFIYQWRAFILRPAGVSFFECKALPK